MTYSIVTSIQWDELNSTFYVLCEVWGNADSVLVARGTFDEQDMMGIATFVMPYVA